MWRKLRRKLWQWQIVAIAACSATGIILLINVLGGFQLLESSTLDRWFRLRPSEEQDPRIVIVGINESDINRLSQWPMSDAVLANVIEKIAAQHPRVIGLDLYRDLPVEPGHQHLRQVLASTPQLIGIEKFLGDAVAPPPILAQLDRVGIADFVLDADGKIRRGLLAIGTDNHPTKFSLGAKLALNYLETEGISLQSSTDRKYQYQLGRSSIRRFEANDGGYIRADTGGYQLLLNFRGVSCGPPLSACPFQMISLSDVLNHQIPSNLLQDRIVLIGVTAPSLGDRFYTPYSYNDATTITGVELHAHLVSQLLSAALDGRTLIQVWPEPLEYLWIFICASGGAIVGNHCFQHRRITVGILLRLGTLALLCGSLVVVAYLAFVVGWWIPMITPLVALVGAAVGSTTYWLGNNLRLSYQALQDYAHSLEQSEKRYATLAAAVPVGIFRTNVLGHCVYVNDRWCQIAGLTPEEANGEGWQRGLHPRDRNLVIARWRHATQNNQPFQLEYRFQRTDKQVTWVYGQAVAEQDVNGQVIGYVGTITDISDRKQAEAKQAQLLTQLGHVNHELEQANQQLADYSQTLERRVEERTADLQAAQERIIAQEKLASLGTLMTGIAHELSNPLNFVKNFAEGSVELSQDLLDTLQPLLSSLEPDIAAMVQTLIADLQENANSIRHHSQRAEQTIVSMMQHNHPDYEQPLPETVHINRLLNQAVKLASYSKQAQDSNFQLSIHTDYEAQLAPIKAIPSSLLRAFINLIDNACDAMRLKQRQLQRSPPKGYIPTLSITVRQISTGLEIRIRDNGCGIAHDIKDKVLDPFFTTKAPGEGTGLGLSITHDIIVKQHQGTLSIDTELGQFTECILTLPDQSSSS